MINNCTLASIALFKVLYDRKKNIYSLLYDFIIGAVLSSPDKRSFTSLEITNFVNDYYKFEIPESVIKTVLKKNIPEKIHTFNLIEKKYVFSAEMNMYSEAINNYKDLQEEYDSIFKKLILYIESKKKTNLSINDKELIKETFYNVLLDSSVAGEYSTLISMFLMSLDTVSKEKLNSIREGIIIYEGVIYTPDLNLIGTWRDKIVFFLSTEHLFHLAGYNGETYQKIFMDFINLVKEINKNSQLIELKFFSETKTEIENYFLSAQNNLEKRLPIESSAMENILKNCCSPSDVLIKKSKFYSLLSQYNIKEDLYDKYWAEENEAYNLIDHGIYEQLKQEKSLQDKQEECEKLLEQLNKVSILRQGNAGRTFNRCKILFISDNKTTFLLQSKLASNENQYFLATSLDSAINSLWFSLNKGFSDKSKLPTLFDVAIKAKFAISHQLSQKIKQDYSFVRERYSDFTEEDLANGYLILKKETQKAENLDFNNENAILDFLSTDILTMAQREKENQSRKAKIGHKNIVELRYRQQKDLFKEKMEVKKKIRLGIIFSTIITILIISLCFIFVCFGIYHIIKSLISENDTLLGIISLVLSIPILNILAFIKKKIFVYIDNMKKNTHASYRKILKPKIHSFRETGKDLAEFQ